MAATVDDMLDAIAGHARSCTGVLGRGHIAPAVVEAMRRVPRERFVPDINRSVAYGDHPLPIGHGQTISQPFIVALMTDLLDVRAGHRVLEVGTGCGYQAAVLGALAAELDTIEIVAPLAESARRTLAALGYTTVRVHHADGHHGLPERAPFDRIIVTAAPAIVPVRLLDQLAKGGVMVIPIGESGHQSLRVIDKDEAGQCHERPTIGVAFVPLTGGGPPDPDAAPNS